MTFVELPVVSIYWHFPRTVKGYCFVFESPIPGYSCMWGVQWSVKYGRV